MSLINTQVQPFKTEAYLNGKFIEVSNETLKGKWSVLIFMPAAFTFNCPTEVEDAADNYAEFQKLGAEVYIVTTDTHFSHKVLHDTSPAVGKAKFPLVGDPTHTLTNAFGVHIPEEGLALRGTFIVNPDGIIKTMEVHSNEIARDVKETLRKLKAAGQRLSIIIITAHDQAETREQCMAEGARAYLRKPLEDRVLLNAISAAMRTPPMGVRT